MHILNKLLSIMLVVSIVLLTFSCTNISANASTTTGTDTNTTNSIDYSELAHVQFSDIPEEHWANSYVHKLRDLNITNGIGNNVFGLGMPISRGEFVTFLVRLMGWELIDSYKGSFDDNLDKNKWYFEYIETALLNKAILKDTNYFRADDLITREEMAIMIVRSLSYENLSQQVKKLETSFIDVERNEGYITIAKDLGIIQGIAQSDGSFIFSPLNYALREEAAAMMIRMHERLNHPLTKLNAFYAIKSYEQKDLIPYLSSVSFGWSQLEYDTNSNEVRLNTTSKNKNDFSIPIGYSEPLSIAKQSNVPAQLMVFLKNESINTARYILTDKEVRSNTIDLILEALQGSDDLEFSGVVIDFENMYGETLRNAFNDFLAELKLELVTAHKSLFVAVHPKRALNQEYFDAYDYRTIGDIADNIILMAHDYNAKQLTEADMESGYTITPLTPIDEIYFSLKAITDKNDGVKDPLKVLLQISFDSAQWKLKDGKVINMFPLRPDYESINKRLVESDVELFYSAINENPYVKFIDPNDETSNIVWYEDSRSVNSKIKLARLFGIGGISLWRLGNIPNYEINEDNSNYLDVWNNIIDSIDYTVE